VEIAESTRLPLAARLIIVGGWVWLLLALIYFTDAACQIFLFLAIGVSGIIVGAVWIALSVMWPRLLRRPARKVWLSVPLAGVLGLLLLSDLGLALRVRLCEGALSEYVAEVSANGVPAERHQWVGLFKIDDTWVYDGGVYLFTSTSLIDQHGVAHLPPGSKPPSRITVSHLYGLWFSFKWKF